MNSKRLDDAFSPTPKVFSDRVDVTLSRIKEMSRMKKRVKMRVTLVAAIILVVALTTAAFATGAIQSIFRMMADRHEEATVDFIQMDELSHKDVHEETLPIEDAGVSSYVEVTQSYYDGEQIMLGARLTAPRLPIREFGPDDEAFTELRSTKNTLWQMKQELPDEDYNAFVTKLQNEGRAGIAYTVFTLSDGFALPDGSDLGNLINADDGIALGETSDFYYESNAPLIESARNRDSVTVVLTVHEAPVYRYIDESGEYVGYGSRVRTNVTFEVKRNAEAGARRRVTKKFGDYAARASILPTLIDTQVAVRLNKPKRWDDEWEGDDGHIYNYQLLAEGILINGELTDWTDEKTMTRDDGDTYIGLYAPLGKERNRVQAPSHNY